MVHVIQFSSTRFDVSRETPNPINPIAGESVLGWLRNAIAAAGYSATEPGPEDWGWYVYVAGADGRYLLGASGENEGAAPQTEWTLQLHKRRTLLEKLTGRNKLQGDDALSALIERCVRDDPGSSDIDVDRDA